MENQQQDTETALNTIFDIMIEDAQLAGNLLGKIRNNSALFMLATTDDGNHGGKVASVYIGKEKIIVESLLHAMDNNESIERAVFSAAKLYAMKKTGCNSLADFLIAYDMQCNCPACRQKRENNESKVN